MHNFYIYIKFISGKNIFIIINEAQKIMSLLEVIESDNYEFKNICVNYNKCKPYISIDINDWSLNMFYERNFIFNDDVKSDHYVLNSLFQLEGEMECAFIIIYEHDFMSDYFGNNIQHIIYRELNNDWGSYESKKILKDDLYRNPSKCFKCLTEEFLSCHVTRAKISLYYQNVKSSSKI